jgi:hypothetical protein
VRIIGKKPKNSKITWKFINQKYGFSKKIVVKALHQDPSLRHKYVDTLEKKKKAVIEAADLFKVPDTDRQLTKADVFAKELTSIVPGVGDSKRYELGDAPYSNQALFSTTHKPKGTSKFA